MSESGLPKAFKTRSELEFHVRLIDWTSIGKGPGFILGSGLWLSQFFLLVVDHEGSSESGITNSGFGPPQVESVYCGFGVRRGARAVEGGLKDATATFGGAWMRAISGEN